MASKPKKPWRKGKPGPKRPKGRPPFKITKKVLDRAFNAARAGAKGYEIAHSLGIHPATLAEKKGEYAELSEAIERGMAESIEIVRGKLFINATEPAMGKDGPVGPPGGSVEAQKFFLQSRAGDKVNNSLEVKGDESAPLAVRIILPSNERKNDGS